MRLIFGFGVSGFGGGGFPEGKLISRLFVSCGVVMMKITNSTKTRSSNGVMFNSFIEPCPSRLILRNSRRFLIRFQSPQRSAHQTAPTPAAENLWAADARYCPSRLAPFSPKRPRSRCPNRVSNLKTGFAQPHPPPVPPRRQTWRPRSPRADSSVSAKCIPRNLCRSHSDQKPSPPPCHLQNQTLAKPQLPGPRQARHPDSPAEAWRWVWQSAAPHPRVWVALVWVLPPVAWARVLWA